MDGNFLPFTRRTGNKSDLSIDESQFAFCLVLAVVCIARKLSIIKSQLASFGVRVDWSVVNLFLFLHSAIGALGHDSG